MSTLKETIDLTRKLADLLEESSLSEIEVEGEGLRVRVARQIYATTTVASQAMPAAAPAAPAAPAADTAASPPAGEPEPAHAGAITAPMVGTVYLAPEPGAPPFVKEGDRVSEGDTLLIVEAMKVMNPIPSPRAGTVKMILVADAQPVEFGEPLLVIE